MLPSNDCYALIRQREGKRLASYPDPATGGAPWTIGYGHTGPEVHPGMMITDQRADELLIDDANRVAIEIQQLVHAPLTQHELDALTCFAYNVGIGNFAKSTMLKLINQGKFAEAADQFPKWDRANGKEMPGLLARREAEEKEFRDGMA